MKKSALVAVLSALVIGGGSILSPVTASAEAVVVSTAELTHSHVGSEKVSGGCYTTKTTQEVPVYCDGVMTEPWTNSAGQRRITCSHGWHEFSASEKARGNTCGAFRYNTTITKYALSCGVTEGATVGTFTISKEAGRTSYYLTPSVSVSSSVCVPVSYTWSNGDIGTCTVTGNGSYTCTLKWTDMGVEKTAELTYVVEDYDTEPPIIESVTGMRVVRSITIL